MKEAYEFIIKKSGIKRGDTVVVSCSSGPDSMALLYFMNQIRKELDLVLICAHVNHNVRAESAEEKEYLEQYCKDEDIIFDCYKIENYSEDNFHNEARVIRYAYMDRVCKKFNSHFLLTAHHGDDLMETILMRIVRGSTLKGYSGFSRIMQKEDYHIIRPFIKVTKAELIEYDKEHNVKYYFDKTNASDAYTRNRYRKYVLPFLKNEDPHVNLKFYKYSEVLLECNEYLEEEAKKQTLKVLKDGILEIDKFKELKHIIQVKIIYGILEKIYNDDLLIISDSHVDLIFDLINSSKANSKIHLPNNVIVNKAYNNLSFTFCEEEKNSYEIEITSLITLPNGKNIEIASSCDWTDNYCTRFSNKDVKLPLYVRNRAIGDKMDVKNMIGKKKVGNIFIDEKINFDERQLWPIVCDSDENIVWIPGIKKSKFDKDINEEYDIILRYY
ncbi:MAG: tRNA lysidine(34) synthetase TilS [Bacilli bacterium]